MKIKVTVSGPGGTIGDVMYSIASYLDSLKAEVSIQDEYPPTADLDKLKRSVAGRKIDLIAEHLPWGG